MNGMMTTVPMFSLLYSSYMMYHVFIMFLWLVFIDKLHDDNSAHVFTTVFIMMYHVFIMFLWLVFIDKLHDDNSAYVFTTVFIMYDVSCIHHVSMACIHR